jgi:surface polysaccharide O-acyltransferase-like enzyme
MSEKQDRVIWADYARVLATFSVVFLHAASPIVDKYNQLPKADWMIGNIYDSAVRMCVPLFFMLTGYLLLDKEETLGTFFQKRINKVVIPLVIWSVFYILWGHYAGGKWPLTPDRFYIVLFGPAYYHLWFPYTLIGLYLYLPILRILAKYADGHLLYYYLALWFLASSLIPVIERTSGLDSTVDLVAISGFAGYLLLGFVGGRIVVTKKVAVLAALTYLVCASITALGTYWLTANNEGKFSGAFYDFLSPNVILLSLSIFLLVKYLVTRFSFTTNQSLLSIIGSVSAASLGIYLIHPIFLDLIQMAPPGLWLNTWEKEPAYSVPVTGLAVFLFSYATISILRRNRILARLAP